MQSRCFSPFQIETRIDREREREREKAEEEENVSSLRFSRVWLDGCLSVTGKKWRGKSATLVSKRENQIDDSIGSPPLDTFLISQSLSANKDRTAGRGREGEREKIDYYDGEASRNSSPNDSTRKNVFCWKGMRLIRSFSSIILWWVEWCVRLTTCLIKKICCTIAFFHLDMDICCPSVYI